MGNGIAQKHRGVGLDQRRNTWYARIKIKGKTIHLGEFKTFEDAVSARLNGEIKYQLPVKMEVDIKEKQIIDLYLGGKSQPEIGKLLNIGVWSVWNILHKRGVKCRDNSKPTDDTQIVDMYKTQTVEQISNNLNLSAGTIKNRLIKNNIDIIPNRKYFIDESMFENIDCEWKAYYLGLFYADAGVGKVNIQLALHEKDRELLDKLNEIVYKNTFELKYSGSKKYISKNNKEHIRGPQYRIYINSKKIVSDLDKLGCGRRKSLTLEFPTINQVSVKFMGHFLRGYFDGDGCIMRNTWQIISSDMFCNSLRRWLYDNMKIDSFLRTAGKVSRLFVHKRVDITKLRHLMYDDATIFLKRKHSRFMEYGY